MNGLQRAKEAYPGWADLLDELKGHKFDTISVKEKYGLLRIHLYGADDLALDKAEELEDRSAKFCELCGNESKRRKDGGWIFNRCDPCWEDGK